MPHDLCDQCLPDAHRWKFPVVGDKEVVCLECGLSFPLETPDGMGIACLGVSQSPAFQDALAAAYRAANS